MTAVWEGCRHPWVGSEPLGAEPAALPHGPEQRAFGDPGNCQPRLDGLHWAGGAAAHNSAGRWDAEINVNPLPEPSLASRFAQCSNAEMCATLRTVQW